MKYVSLEEYQAAKNEILFGIEYRELVGLSEFGRAHIIKSYTTEENGAFYEIDEDGVIQFWSDKYTVSRYYNAQADALQSEKSTVRQPEKSPVWDEEGILMGQIRLLIASNEALAKRGYAQHCREIRKNAEAINRLIETSRSYR